MSTMEEIEQLEGRINELEEKVNGLEEVLDQATQTRWDAIVIIAIWTLFTVLCFSPVGQEHFKELLTVAGSATAAAWWLL